MDINTVRPEEIEALRAVAPWVKVLGSGLFVSLVVTLWKVFGFYKRLSDVEERVESLKGAGYMTQAHHDLLTVTCQAGIEAKIEKKTTELHIKWLEKINEVRQEIAEFREIQCNMLGKLDEISKSVDSLKHSINNGKQR